MSPNKTRTLGKYNISGQVFLTTSMHVFGLQSSLQDEYSKSDHSKMQLNADQQSLDIELSLFEDIASSSRIVRCSIKDLVKVVCPYFTSSHPIDG
jgi:hypothetical protein